MAVVFTGTAAFVFYAGQRTIPFLKNQRCQPKKPVWQRWLSIITASDQAMQAGDRSTKEL
jgi:hypothetical protein